MADWQGPTTGTVMFGFGQKTKLGKKVGYPTTSPRVLEARPMQRRIFQLLSYTCRQGEELNGTAEIHGWVLCKNTLGLEGWVPAKKPKKKCKSLGI